jgi:hypothetical protein
MVIQYPHTLKVFYSEGSTKDVKGNWSKPGADTIREGLCRCEPNGSSGFITAADGARIDFAWTVYLPLPQSRIQEGSRVEVWNGEEKLASDTVKRFSQGQLNARLWL